MARQLLLIARSHGVMAIDGTSYYRRMRKCSDGWHFAKEQARIDVLAEAVLDAVHAGFAASRLAPSRSSIACQKHWRTQRKLLPLLTLLQKMRSQRKLEPRRLSSPMPAPWPTCLPPKLRFQRKLDPVPLAHPLDRHRCSLPAKW